MVKGRDALLSGRFSLRVHLAAGQEKASEEQQESSTTQLVCTVNVSYSPWPLTVISEEIWRLKTILTFILLIHMNMLIAGRLLMVVK